jgi:LPXTG-motif cell wall-anchored protein
MAGGLAMAETPAVVAKLGSTTLTTTAGTNSSSGTYDVTIAFSAADIAAQTPAAGDEVTVDFNGQLTSTNLVVGGKGNVCSVTMDYSNDPNGANENSMGKTAAATATVFSYQLVVNKVRPTKEGESATYTVGSDTYVALPGAGFTLYKQVPKTQSSAKDGSTTENVTVATIVASDTGTQFVFTGLDAGTYILSETATPDGYNTIDDITFTIASTIALNSSTGLYYLSGLTGSGASFSTSASDGVYDGTLTTYVVNQAGVTLPETGGRGTTLLYIVGGLLVTGAGVLLLTRRRMEDQ